MCTVDWKSQRYCWRLPFLVLEYQEHIFIQCLWFNESDHSGGGFCLHRQSLGLCGVDRGHRDHKEQSSDEHRDNKSPLTLLSHLWQHTKGKKKREKRKNNGGWIQSLRPTESSTIFKSMSLNLICDTRRWASPPAGASVTFSLCVKQRGIKQLQTKVSTRLGILSSHKVLLQRLTVTFTGSESGKRHPVSI